MAVWAFTPCLPPTAERNGARTSCDLVHVEEFDMTEIVDFTEFEAHDAFLEGTGSMVLDRPGLYGTQPKRQRPRGFRAMVRHHGAGGHRV